MWEHDESQKPVQNNQSNGVMYMGTQEQAAEEQMQQQEQQSAEVILPKEAEKVRGESYDWREQELIQELVQKRMAQNAELEYEDLEGYEIPPRTQFSMLSKPAVSLKYRKLCFNSAAVRLFGDICHIIPSFNKDKMRLVAMPCKEEESASVDWARKKEGILVSKEITSEEFVESIFSTMNWERNCRYKALGHIANSERGLILVFDMKEAIQYAALPTEYEDPFTGETKKRRQAYYPEMYKGRIGKSYSDYKEEHQMNLFEYLEGYTGKTYSDMPQEEQQETQQSQQSEQ